MVLVHFQSIHSSPRVGRESQQVEEESTEAESLTELHTRLPG